MVRFKDIRLIALDLDDTTLCSDGNLADKTREAIEAAISSGIEVVIASGRAFNSLPRARCGDMRNTLCHNLKRRCRY